MPKEQSGELTYTAGQAARMLGCSLRTLYRWEESGVIPPANRTKRGQVNARIYTAEQVEAIREKVQDRLDFAKAVPPVPSASQQLDWPRVWGELALMMVLPVPEESKKLFVKAIEFARKHGCSSITVTATDGKEKMFSLKRRKSD